MKQLHLLLFFVFILAGCQEKATVNTITGTILDAEKGSKIVLTTMDPQTDQTIILDVSPIDKEGKFTLETNDTYRFVFLYELDEEEEATVEEMNLNNPGTMIYLEDYAKIKVTADSGELMFAKIEGGLYSKPAMKSLNDVHRKIQEIYQEGNKIAEQAFATGDMQKISEAQQKYAEADQYMKEVERLQREFMTNNPDITYSAALLEYDPELRQNPDVMESMFLSFSPKVQQSVSGERIRASLEAMKSSQEGGVLPDFNLPDRNGERVRLSDFRGQYVILDLWGSWCGPCRASSPHLVELYQKIKDNQNIQMIGVGVWEQSLDNWLDAIEEDQLDWLQVIDTDQGDGVSVMKKYGLNGVPATFLLDPDGTILLRDHPMVVIPQIQNLLDL